MVSLENENSERMGMPYISAELAQTRVGCVFSHTAACSKCFLAHWYFPIQGRLKSWIDGMRKPIHGHGRSGESKLREWTLHCYAIASIRTGMQHTLQKCVGNVGQVIVHISVEPTSILSLLFHTRVKCSTHSSKRLRWAWSMVQCPRFINMKSTRIQDSCA